MKVILSSLILAFSANSHALVKRVTTLDCKNPNNTSSIQMMFDTSISPYVPQVFKVLKQDTNDIVMEVRRGASEYSGTLPDGKKYKFLIPDQEGKKNYEFKTKLFINEVPSTVDCKVITKMKLDISRKENVRDVNDSDRAIIKESPSVDRPDTASPSASQQ